MEQEGLNTSDAEPTGSPRSAQSVAKGCQNKPMDLRTVLCGQVSFCEAKGDGGELVLVTS